MEGRSRKNSVEALQSTDQNMLGGEGDLSRNSLGNQHGSAKQQGSRDTIRRCPATSTSQEQRGSHPAPPSTKPESVLFAPYTPGGELRRILQAVDKEVMGSHKYGRVKVVERLGDNLITALSNKAPWRSEACERPNCMPCRSKAGSCKARNITYSITCNLCTKIGEKAVYWGESHRTLGDRAENHRVALETGDLE